MEHFRDAYSVRLLGHTGKYLGASEDRKSVEQKKGKDSYGVIWRVEVVADGTAIRLKSVYDLYLMASDYAFLLGVTGKKVMQSRASKADSSLEWEPVSAGPNHVKLMTKGEKFLRANGGVPPYRNSVTHDVPVLASNQNVVLWEVDVVRKKDAASLPPSRLISPRVSNASQPSNASPPVPPQPQPQAESSDDDIPAPVIPKPRLRTNAAPPRIKIPPTAVDSSSPSEPASPVAPSPPPRRRATPQTEQPRRQAEAVGNVPQRRRASPSESPLPRPSRDVTYDESPPPRRRAGDAEYDQSPPPRRRATKVYESPPPPPRRQASPVYESPPPQPRRQASPTYESPPPPRRRASPVYESPPPPRRRASPVYESPPPPRRRAARREDYDSERGGGRPRQQRRDEYESSPEPSQSARPSVRSSGYEDSENLARSGSQKVKSPDIRRIFYSVAEDDGEVLAHDEESFGTFMFKGHGLEELTAELQRVTGINEDIILCMRNPMSAKLYKMRLALPPNKAPLSIVIVRKDSQFGRTFSTQTSRQ